MLQIVRKLSSPTGDTKESPVARADTDVSSLGHQFNQLWNRILKQGRPDQVGTALLTATASEGGRD